MLELFDKIKAGEFALKKKRKEKQILDTKYSWFEDKKFRGAVREGFMQNGGRRPDIQKITWGLNWQNFPGLLLFMALFPSWNIRHRALWLYVLLLVWGTVAGAIINGAFRKHLFLKILGDKQNSSGSSEMQSVQIPMSFPVLAFLLSMLLSGATLVTARVNHKTRNRRKIRVAQK